VKLRGKEGREKLLSQQVSGTRKDQTMEWKSWFEPREFRDREKVVGRGKPGNGGEGCLTEMSRIRRNQRIVEFLPAEQVPQ